ncbi:MAG: TIGR01212 family radical SAM protein [Lentisphaeria bacterium]|nr:TIGR01212 family radical SAM protein [Lentisphaeria bacterium]
MSDPPFLSFKTFMIQRYGTALHRVPVDVGYGCPNRGPDGRGGCAFCAETGGRAVQITGITDLQDQLSQGITFARQRYHAQAFMLYIQAYTGTFADSAVLGETIAAMLADHPFRALSVGTRPDCLNDDVMAVLRALNERLDVWVELGVQTTHDDTLTRVRRGHDWAASRDAVIRLHKAGLRPAAHVILGLPGETPDHWCQTAERLARLPLAAVKLHNLHVIRGTGLAADYADSPFPTLDEHQYTEAVIDFLRRLPADMPIMRLTTDTPDDQLIAPRWHLSKGQFLNHVIKQMRFRNARQGDWFSGRKRPAAGPAEPTADFTPLATGDGSVTFWNPVFKEHYHAKVGAQTEAREKFIIPSGLGDRLRRGTGDEIHLLDICFGLGYNTLAAVAEAMAVQKTSKRLRVTALEIDAGVVAAAAKHVTPPADSAVDRVSFFTALSTDGHWEHERCSVDLFIGDARARLPEPPARFDIIFLDAFSTQRNAELWTLDFFIRLKSVLAPAGVLLTYSAALPVRGALLRAGFAIGETPPIGRRRGGTIAAASAEWIARPLQPDELTAIRTTTRGLPYRDPSQTRTNRQILRDRENRVREARKR